ncbi:hypothetical protein GE061_000774 [Apolygus lucorum]|uniref:Peptidase S1 domain-containing protein n=1 Tax=Apolygus lucorum TaxID=248454 RepID=A0A8S9Y586_APOLU|nr:hypothetical protein GE061_000774 [Apolygus lucorum]
MIFYTTVITSVVLASFVQGSDPVTPIPIKRAPYKVLLVQRFNKTQVIGTGAILNNQWVITTASTIINHKNKPHSLMIRSGSGIYNQGGGLHEVDRIIIHPDFQKASANQHLGKGDLALLKIYFNFHSSLTVAQIPTPHHVTTENTTAHVVSWPIVSGKNTKALKAESTKTVNWEKCQESYSSKTALDVTTMCTQKLTIKAQEGDALISRAELIGLLKSSSSSDMQAYVDMASYKIWIDEITAGR